MSRGLVGASSLLVVLLLTALSGCLDTGDDPAPEGGEVILPGPGAGIDEAALSDAKYGIAPRLVESVEMADGTRIYVEIFLPDAEGPWPTILEISPYNHIGDRLVRAEFGLDNGDTGLVERYVPRGYAVVHAHMRGTGNSDGCIDMMGPLEQQDSHDLVQWSAQQQWSDGKIGMHGVSYVGTTPHMAAIMNPENLVTIVTIAGVTNQWRNVYMNGVPYDGRFYPLTYEALVNAPPPLHVTHGPDWITAVGSGVCINQEAVDAMSPGTYEKGLYTEYWHERNLTRWAGDVQASILYSQGFIDRAVNPIEALGWFDEITSPKKAFLHQGGHIYPPRDDYFTVELAWFDHWLKGIENGVMNSAPVEVQTNRDTIRVADHWPPQDAENKRYYLAPGALTSHTPEDDSETYTADQWRSLALSGGALMQDVTPTNRLEYVTEPLETELYMAGTPRFHLTLSTDAENTYFLSDLYLVRGDEWTRLTEGWMNAHLREGFDKSAPLVPSEPATMQFIFEPREWVFEEGDQIGLVIKGNDGRVGPIDLMDAVQTENTVHYGEGRSWLELPVLAQPQEHARPDHV
jgi:predicted acyl esterase